MMPRLMIAPTAVPASSTASKAASITRAHSGRGSSFTRTSTMTPSSPSEPVISASRSKPGASRAGAPMVMRSPFHGDHLELLDVVHGEPVLQAVQPARVLRHVAADGARDLRGGIRRVVEPEMGDRLRDREVAHPGLHPGAAVQGIDLEDAVELREAEQHAVGEGEGAAGEPGPGAASDDRDALARAERENRLDLLGGVGQHHHHRDLAVRGESVALVGAELLLLGEDALRGKNAAEFGEKRPETGTGHRRMPLSPGRADHVPILSRCGEPHASRPPREPVRARSVGTLRSPDAFRPGPYRTHSRTGPPRRCAPGTFAQ